MSQTQTRAVIELEPLDQRALPSSFGAGMPFEAPETEAAITSERKMGGPEDDPRIVGPSAQQQQEAAPERKMGGPEDDPRIV